MPSTERAPSTLPDGWRERVARTCCYWADPAKNGTCHDAYCSHKCCAVQPEKQFYDMADAIGEVFGATGDGWRPIETAPKDGTPIWVYCIHRNHKYAPDHDKARWTEVVLAQWIDHNGGGWTWNGIAGEFRAWMPTNKPDKPSSPTPSEKKP